MRGGRGEGGEGTYRKSVATLFHRALKSAEHQDGDEDEEARASRESTVAEHQQNPLLVKVTSPPCDLCILYKYLVFLLFFFSFVLFFSYRDAIFW